VFLTGRRIGRATSSSGLKQAGRLATRAERLPVHYRALVALALSVRYATHYVPDTT
jgi:hypothetical protein